MKSYEFGDKNKPVILLLPGTCCHWKANIGEVVPQNWVSEVETCCGILTGE